MSEAYQRQSEKAAKNATSGKTQYDKKAKTAVLQPGDRVLIRNVKERGGPGKLWSYWEDAIYQIVRQKSDEIPVYEVIPESGEGKTRTLHRMFVPPGRKTCNETAPTKTSKQKEE